MEINRNNFLVCIFVTLAIAIPARDITLVLIKYSPKVIISTIEINLFSYILRFIFAIVLSVISYLSLRVDKKKILNNIDIILITILLIPYHEIVHKFRISLFYPSTFINQPYIVYEYLCYALIYPVTLLLARILYNKYCLKHYGNIRLNNIQVIAIIFSLIMLLKFDNLEVLHEMLQKNGVLLTMIWKLQAIYSYILHMILVVIPIYFILRIKKYDGPFLVNICMIFGLYFVISNFYSLLPVIKIIIKNISVNFEGIIKIMSSYVYLSDLKLLVIGMTIFTISLLFLVWSHKRNAIY